MKLDDRQRLKQGCLSVPSAIFSAFFARWVCGALDKSLESVELVGHNEDYPVHEDHLSQAPGPWLAATSTSKR